jgi:hypothetical protein
LQDEALAKRLAGYRSKMAQDVEKKAQALAERLASEKP